jgi:hypothetical protein
MLGNDTVFEHLVKYLGFKTGDGQISKDGLTRYVILSDCDDFSLEDRQEFMAEIDVEGNIIEISKNLGLKLYTPSPQINDNSITEVVEPEPDTYRPEQVGEMLGPGVFEHFKSMLGHKENFTIKDLVAFAVESECDTFYLDDRNDFLEDIGIDGDIYDAAKIFGLTPYSIKEPEGEHEDVELESEPDVPDFYSNRKYKLEPSDRIPPEPKDYSSFFTKGNQKLNSYVWFRNNFADLGTDLLKEFYSYCEECVLNDIEIEADYKDGNIYTDAISMYRFFYENHPELIFGTYNGDCFRLFFREIPKSGKNN